MPALERQARAMPRRFPLIAGHNDLPWALRERAGGARGAPVAVDLAAPVDGTHTDLPRLAPGGVGAQVWPVFVPPSFSRARAGAPLLQHMLVVPPLNPPPPPPL